MLKLITEGNILWFYLCTILGDGMWGVWNKIQNYKLHSLNAFDSTEM